MDRPVLCTSSSKPGSALRFQTPLSRLASLPVFKALRISQTTDLVYTESVSGVSLSAHFTQKPHASVTEEARRRIGGFVLITACRHTSAVQRHHVLLPDLFLKSNKQQREFDAVHF